MKSLVILLVSIAPCLSWFPGHTLYNIKFNSDQEICKKLNETLFSIVANNEDWKQPRYEEDNTHSNATYVFPRFVSDVEGKKSSDSESENKEFHFYKSDNDVEPVLKISVNLPRNANLSELMPDGSAKYIFPVKYHVSELYLERYRLGEIMSFFLIQGERCKAYINDKTKQLINKKCWNTPGFCRGTKEQCIRNDDVDSLCYDASTGEGKRKDEPNATHYSVELGEMIFWESHFRILAISYEIDRYDPVFYRWNCTDVCDHVKCIQINDEGNPLQNDKLFNSDQQLCKKFNKTLYGEEKLESKSNDDDNYYEDAPSFVLPGNFLDVEGREVDQDWVTKNFSFYFIPSSLRENPLPRHLLNITTKIPKNSTIKDLMWDGTVRDIFPVNYRMTVLYDNNDTPFYLIEGERCKAVYDQKTEKLVNRRCWSTPSFCRGNRRACLLNDDEDALCYNADTEEGKKRENTEEIHYSLNIGERIYFKDHHIPYGLDDINVHYDNWLLKWNCTELVDYVLCEIYEDVRALRITTLKSIAGFNG